MREARHDGPTRIGGKRNSFVATKLCINPRESHDPNRSLLVDDDGLYGIEYTDTKVANENGNFFYALRAFENDC